MTSAGGRSAAHHDDTTYRVCVRCVMDTSDRDITFDDDGVCNHCHTYDERFVREVVPGPAGRARLEQIVERVKREGRGHDYDCVMGVSGGVDSSYVALLSKELGLRPLAVHLDNGWDSELAVQNIQNIVTKLGIDLVTHVVDWEEFRDLQVAFMRASVVDIEVVTDHAINALVYRTALAEDVHYLLSGHNFVTESVMPVSWGHRKSDLRNLRALARRFGGVGIRSLPTASTLRHQWWQLVRRVRSVPVLNYLDYDKQKAMAALESELDWRYYGGKHYESLFTRFYQAYILPTKFGIDKRRAHLSALVLSGQLDRDEALAELQQPLYDPRQLADDKVYVAKKLGLTEGELDDILRQPPRSHLDYASDEPYVRPLLNLKAAVRRARTRTPSR